MDDLENGAAVEVMPEQTKTKAKKTAKKSAAKKAVKKTAKKAAGKKTVATGAERRKFTDDMKITITDPDRAAKMHETSRRYQSFKVIKAGMSVAKYLEKGGDRLDMTIMDKLGIISVS